MLRKDGRLKWPLMTGIKHTRKISLRTGCLKLAQLGGKARNWQPRRTWRAIMLMPAGGQASPGGGRASFRSMAKRCVRERPQRDAGLAAACISAAAAAAAGCVN